MNIDKKLNDWKEVRELLFKVKDARGRKLKTVFYEYLEKRNLYELRYHEKFNKLQMPY